MGNKAQNTLPLNWQSATPIPFVPNTPPSGVTGGAMAATNTIYTQIVDITLKDNLGLEITWTGTAVGTISVLCSSSGTAFYPLSFSPSITQPAGSAGGYLIDLNQVPWKYILIKYINTSGSGTLNVTLTTKDLN